MLRWRGVVGEVEELREAEPEVYVVGLDDRAEAITASLPPRFCASSMLMSTGAYTTTWLRGWVAESCDIARFRFALKIDKE